MKEQQELEQRVANLQAEVQQQNAVLQAIALKLGVEISTTTTSAPGK